MPLAMISWAEIVIISITLLILLIYHAHLAYKVRSSPLTTAIGITNQLRRDYPFHQYPGCHKRNLVVD